MVKSDQSVGARHAIKENLVMALAREVCPYCGVYETLYEPSLMEGTHSCYANYHHKDRIMCFATDLYSFAKINAIRVRASVSYLRVEPPKK